MPLSTSSEQALPSMLQPECDLPGPLPWVKKNKNFDPFTFDLAGQSGMWRQVGSVEVVFHARPRKHCCARAILKTSRGEFETAATLTPSSLAPLVVCNSAYFGMFGPKSVRSKERVRDSEHCLRKRSWRILTESVTMLCLV